MKINYYLIAAASATLMLTGCSQSDVVEMPANRAIGFGTYVGNTSRTVTDTDRDELQKKSNGFYVFGSYTDGTSLVDVFDGKSDGSHVTYNATSWGYSPINYWLDGKTYKFAAFGPKTALDDGTKSFNYTDNTLKVENFNANGTLDLIVAEGDKDGYTSVEGTSMATVSFKFFHALSKVRFTFKNGWRNDVTLKVSDVKINNVKSTGTLVTTGTLNKANAQMPLTQWTGQDNAKEYIWTDEFSTNVFDKTSSDDEKALYEYFFIPQEIGTEENAIKLTFTCSVLNDNGNGPDLGSGAGNEVEVNVTIPTTTVASWAPGTAYNYVLTIDGKLFDLKPIQFDVIEVKAWTPTGENEIDDDHTEIVKKEALTL